jgi:hypothetical protein
MHFLLRLEDRPEPATPRIRLLPEATVKPHRRTRGSSARRLWQGVVENAPDAARFDTRSRLLIYRLRFRAIATVCVARSRPLAPNGGLS